MKYVIINHDKIPPSCLPENLDRSPLIDITAIGDSWRKYLDPSTGKVHDGAEYYEDARWQAWQENDIQESEFNG